MIAKIISFLVRAALGFLVPWGLAIFTYEVLTHSDEAALVVGVLGWVSGGIWAILMTNRPFVFLERLDQSFAKTIDGRERRKAADEMLALKKLLDEGILEQAEYEEKIKGLKERYLA